jgi:hypothetical protein
VETGASGKVELAQVERVETPFAPPVERSGKASTKPHLTLVEKQIPPVEKDAPLVNSTGGEAVSPLETFPPSEKVEQVESGSGASGTLHFGQVETEWRAEWLGTSINRMTLRKRLFIRESGKWRQAKKTDNLGVPLTVNLHSFTPEAAKRVQQTWGKDGIKKYVQQHLDRRSRRRA